MQEVPQGDACSEVQIRTGAEARAVSHQDCGDFWVPSLVVNVPSWPRTFFGGLGDLLFAPFRRRSALQLTSRPAPFWPDVFVNRRLPVAPFRQSLLCHILLVVAVWGASRTWLEHSVKPENPLQKYAVVYYPVSEYLPPINDIAHGEPAKVERKGEPVYARQRIISLPPRPDNQSQTIVTPSPLSIHDDVLLPNIVAWTPTAAPVPAAAARAARSQLAIPQLPAAIAPPAEAVRTRLTLPVLEQAAPVAPPPSPTVPISLPRLPLPTVVAPAPTVAGAAKLPNFAAPAPVPPPPAIQAKLPVPMLPAPAVVEPPPPANRARPVGELNVGRLEASVAAPRLPVAEQRIAVPAPTADAARTAATPSARVPASPSLAAVAGLRSNTSRVGGTGIGPDSSSAVAPPLPASAIAGESVNRMAAGQIIALNVHPVAPAGPIEVPAGNRRGTFAAGPEGKPNAPGTPDIPAGGKKDGGGSGSTNPESSLAGITIAAGPVNPGPVAVVNPSITPAKPPSASATKNALLAALGPSRPSDLARYTRPPVADSGVDPKIDKEVFGKKKYYAMTLNLPNLASTGGSWVVRFAELHQSGETSELTPPVPTVKVDPAYPTELMRGRVEGVVVLYAIIRADGSVDQVRVLRGFDQRLSSSARAALMKWRFRPATKNGNAVDLEAVVQIPFQSRPAF